jgi:hypothetical protein
MSTHLYFTGLFLGKEDMFVFEAPEYDSYCHNVPENAQYFLDIAHVLSVNAFVFLVSISFH